MSEGGTHITPPRCPDGSWSKRRWRHCLLPMGHSGDHEYEVHLIEDERPPEHVFEDFRRLHGIEEQRG